MTEERIGEKISWSNRPGVRSQERVVRYNKILQAFDSDYWPWLAYFDPHMPTYMWTLHVPSSHICVGSCLHRHVDFDLTVDAYDSALKMNSVENSCTQYNCIQYITTRNFQRRHEKATPRDYWYELDCQHEQLLSFHIIQLPCFPCFHAFIKAISIPRRLSSGNELMSTVSCSRPFLLDNGVPGLGYRSSHSMVHKHQAGTICMSQRDGQFVSAEIFPIVSRMLCCRNPRPETRTLQPEVFRSRETIRD